MGSSFLRAALVLLALVVVWQGAADAQSAPYPFGQQRFYPSASVNYPYGPAPASSNANEMVLADNRGPNRKDCPPPCPPPPVCFPPCPPPPPAWCPPSCPPPCPPEEPDCYCPPGCAPCCSRPCPRPCGPCCYPPPPCPPPPPFCLPVSPQDVTIYGMKPQQFRSGAALMENVTKKVKNALGLEDAVMQQQDEATQEANDVPARDDDTPQFVRDAYAKLRAEKLAKMKNRV